MSFSINYATLSENINELTLIFQ